MVVKIRLARFGRRNSPFYNIVIAHARYAQLSTAQHTQRSILPQKNTHRVTTTSHRTKAADPPN